MSQAQLQEELIPSGGIADFVMSDEEIAALEAEEAREEFGQEGIARFEPIAKRIASYGRFGDDNLAHVETGELLVPRALIEDNPKLKESIFSHLREMGIEDPDRYVVGSSANSINPDTGLPEFFLKKIFSSAKKAVSNVAKGVSKAVKSVGKVLKKVAPVVLPIALAMTPLGAMYGAALGSGIGTLIQGGNIKDALKSALISGAIGGISSGISSKMGGGTFTGGIKEAAANPMARLSQTGKALGAGDPFRSFTPTGSQVADAGVSEAQELAGTQGTTTTDIQAQDTKIYSPNAVDPGANMKLNASGELVMAPTGDLSGVDQFAKGAPGYVDTSAAYTSGVGAPPVPVSSPIVDPGAGLTLDASGNLVELGTTAPPSFMDQVTQTGKDLYEGATNLYSDYLSPSRNAPTTADIAKKAGEIQAAYAAEGVQITGAKAAEMASSQLAPNMITSYAPLVGLAGAGAAAGGFFDVPEEEPNELAEEFQQTGSDLIAQSPETFMLAGRDPRYSQGQYVVPTQYGLGSMPMFFNNPFMRYQAPQMRAAAGGEVYPRRNGGIMPNEGVPDQDSVRALLMPGEFVMTKDAVKGLGGGSMTRGIDNMYSMMRNLEAKGQVA